MIERSRRFDSIREGSWSCQGDWDRSEGSWAAARATGCRAEGRRTPAARPENRMIRSAPHPPPSHSPVRGESHSGSGASRASRTVRCNILLVTGTARTSNHPNLSISTRTCKPKAATEPLRSRRGEQRNYKRMREGWAHHRELLRSETRQEDHLIGPSPGSGWGASVLLR